MDVKEQCVFIKLVFKFGKNVAETHKIIKQSYGDDALDYKQTYNGLNTLKMVKHHLEIMNI